MEDKRHEGMNSIRVLDRLVASKIAAGEVIERPASVVKELMENSIDAGATSIAVRIEKGGRDLIRVQDNGCGIRAEDAGLVIERHATSKIKAEEDLLGISTLGFRGEAMASIAAVSRLTITTRARGEELGVRLTMEAGGEPVISPVGCREGTIVVVEDLFFNMPVRLKFLRSPQTEAGRVTEVFRTIALINPGIRFSLEGDRNRGIHLQAQGLRERFLDITAEGKTPQIMDITSSHIEGFICGPEDAVRSPRGLHTYLNGRPIRDRTVMRALADGYGRLIERGQYPLGLINLKIPPSEVDVNIHPAKTEVRFRNAGAVYSLVRGAVQKALARKFRGGQAVHLYRPGEREGDGPEGANLAGEVASGYGHGTLAEEGEGPGPAWEEESGSHRKSGQPRGREGLFETEAGKGIRNPEFLGLRITGQIWDEFLLAESSDNDGLFYIIDQHGAEERGAYERLRRDFFAGRLKRQLLLLPERIETTAEEAEALASAMDRLQGLGFEITPFGPSPDGGETFMLKSVPHILPAQGFSTLLKTLAGEICNSGGSARMEERIDKALMTIACHSVIRGPRRLTREEGMNLLENLARMDFAGYCPHGRPVVKRLTRKEIEAFFKR